MSTMDQAMNYLADHSTWKYAGQGTGTGGGVAIPNTAKEVYVEVIVNNTATYTATAPAPFTSSSRWQLGGYYYSSSDHGLCNLNVSNGGLNFAIRYATYSGTNYSSTSKLKVYYK